MIRNFFEKDSVLKISSFLIAILIWLYVIYIEDPKVKVTIDDIPVRYKASELSDELAVVGFDVKTVDVEIEATRSEIINFDDSDIEAYLDLSDISESGKHDNIKIKVSCLKKDVSIVDSSDNKTAVHIDDVVSKNMPIGIEFRGNTPEGYAIISEPALFVESTKLTGPKKYVESVKHLFISIDCDNLTESKTISSDILILDDKNVVIDKNHEAYKHLKLSDKKVSAYVSVGKTKKVDVVINGAKDGEKYTISPSTVEVYSKNNIREIYTESIEGKSITHEKGVKVRLVIPKDVILVSDEKNVRINLKK